MDTNASSVPRRIFWPASILLLACLCTVQVRSALKESVIADEPTELAAGYSYLKTGDFRMNPEHPPLAKLIAALPLLRFGLVPLWHLDSWRKGVEASFGEQWLGANPRKTDAMVLAGRLTSILLTFCLGLAIALWTRAVFGPAAALVALAMYASDPSVIAHGRYIKNDLPVALFAFLASIAWTAWLNHPRPHRLLLSGILLGLALATKFSALFLLPVFTVLYATYHYPEFPVRRHLTSFAAVALLAGAVVYLTYQVPALVHGTSLPGIDARLVEELLDRSDAGVMSRPGGGPLRVHPFFAGLLSFLDHETIGHRAYLLGKVETQGWWYYFPVAFAVKTPACTLALLALAAALALIRLRRASFRRVAFDWYALALPVAVFSAFAMAGSIDVGIRHLLPLFPFLFVLCGAVIARSGRLVAGLAIVLCLGLAAESISIYPHYLAFFNFLAGGPSRGPEILADSNIDWGQDAKKLAAWLRANPPRRLCVDYWGSANLAQLGISAPSLMARWQADGRIPVDCIAAVSTNILYGVQPGRGEFGWLRDLPPIARIGYSIYVFDLPRLVRTSGSVLFGADAPAFQSVMHGNLRGAPTRADPARSGEILAFFMTGLGPVDPPVPPGRPAPLAPLSRTRFPVICRWDNAEDGPLAEILFAGLAPGKTGIYQVNARVSRDAKSGQVTCRTALFSAAASRGASIVVPVATY